LDTDTPRTFQTSEFRLDQSQKSCPLRINHFHSNKEKIYLLWRITLSQRLDTTNSVPEYTTTGLPIDKPRYATYVDATSTTREVVYPNIFSEFFEEYGEIISLKQSSLLGMSGALYVFQTCPGLQEGVKTAQDGQKILLIDANKARSFVEWKAPRLKKTSARYDGVSQSMLMDILMTHLAMRRCTSLQMEKINVLYDRLFW
jgi:hypothetical protein